MFKELGEFIDDVGRATGKIIKRGVDSLLNDSKSNDLGSEIEMGLLPPDVEEYLENLPEDLKRELEKGEEVVVRDHTKNNK